MLVEHGMMGREYNQVLSNTVAAFALGDYEWLLALEADELHDTVDLMRHLRASGARMHVREEIAILLRPPDRRGGRRRGAAVTQSSVEPLRAWPARDRRRAVRHLRIRRGTAGRVRRPGGTRMT